MKTDHWSTAVETRETNNDGPFKTISETLKDVTDLQYTPISLKKIKIIYNENNE